MISTEDSVTKRVKIVQLDMADFVSLETGANATNVMDFSGKENVAAAGGFRIHKQCLVDYLGLQPRLESGSGE